MAQPKVNDFFSTRKRRDAQPAKRRKVEVPLESLQNSTSLTLTKEDSKSQSVLESTLRIPSPSPSGNKATLGNFEFSRNVTSSCSDPAKTGSGTESKPDKTSLSSGTSCQRKERFTRSRASNLSRARGSSRSKFNGTKNVQIPSAQTKITDLLKLPSSQSKDDQVHDTRSMHAFENRSRSSAEQNKNNADAISSSTQSADQTLIEKDTLSMISEEITSTDDDHINISMSTPRKRNIEPATDTDPPKTRKCKVAHRRGTVESDPENTTRSRSSPSKSAKKKLDLDTSEEFDTSSANVQETSDVGTSQSSTFKDGKGKGSEDAETDKGQGPSSSKNFLLRLVSEVESPDMPISPLARTPERHEDSPSPGSESQEERPASEKGDNTPTVEPCSPKLKNLSHKLKALSKMNGKALKNRLKQNGKLEDVKQKLGDLTEALDKSEGVKAGQDEVDGEVVVDRGQEKEKETLPAYQRFEYLAKEGKPSLTLPFSYNTLAEAFQAMDTIVSMLHNRSEMCTFSKLKAAVQNVTKKNFEEKMVGRIKTVAPDAYLFRQEKNVCDKNNKKGYALTVEADLTKEAPDNMGKNISKTPEGKPMFTASALIRRKQHFHNNLVGLVMKHHREFLASLKPPMSIPDSKITRWHPRFQLDRVPEISPSPLPQPPDVRVYHSAKDVLDAQKGKLNPRVEEALSKVAAENKESNSTLSSSSSSWSSPSKPPQQLNAGSAPSSPSMKGIPPALLAKIRAKEALKMEAALTRNPEEDNKTKMMGHLPEMIRILRSYFVTEKKPALPVEAVYKKLEDSYRSGISRKDVEQHVKLMAQMAPELVSVVEIKRGSFLKFDKNVDTQAISARIMKLVQSRK